MGYYGGPPVWHWNNKTKSYDWVGWSGGDGMSGGFSFIMIIVLIIFLTTTGCGLLLLMFWIIWPLYVFLAVEGILGVFYLATKGYETYYRAKELLKGNPYATADDAWAQRASTEKVPPKRTKRQEELRQKLLDPNRHCTVEELRELGVKIEFK